MWEDDCIYYDAMELSHKYEVERDELKKKILELNQQLAKNKRSS